MTISTTATNTMQISWPTNAIGYVLRENPACDTTNWLEVTNTFSAIGTNNEVTISLLIRNRFFQLVHS